MFYRKYLKCLIATLLSAIVTDPATSQTLSHIEQATLATGRAVVQVSPDNRGADGQIFGVIEIPAPRSSVWRVLVDCDHAPEIMANLRSCRVLQQPGAEPAGEIRWDVREHEIAWVSVLPTVRSVFRSEYVTDTSIRFTKTDGSDLSALDGEWRLEPLAGDQGTRLIYRARFGFLAVVPSFIVRQSLASDFPRFLEKIRVEAMKSR